MFDTLPIRLRDEALLVPIKVPLRLPLCLHLPLRAPLPLQLPPLRRLQQFVHVLRLEREIFLVLMKCFFIFKCRHVSSFRGSSVQS